MYPSSLFSSVLIGAIALFLSACSAPSTDFSSSMAKPIKHQTYHQLLQKHVSARGQVNYEGFVADKAIFGEYLDKLSAHPPAERWSKNEKLAYWINVYNAFTIKLVADHYPVESIRDIGPSVAIPLVNTVWHIKFFKIGGKEMNLDAVEHQILRKEFDEPRIHFAIVCASKSCPKLLNEAYTADKIDKQLTQQTKAFLADDFRNKISADKLELSKIFSWFKGDFTKDGTLIEFIDQYTEVAINEQAKIRYLAYDWSLNDAE